MDWDEDGDFDLLVGDRDGVIEYFRNDGSTTNPSLTSAGMIQDGSSTLDVGDNASCVVADWNNDGLKDLVIGNSDYQVRVYLNQNTNASPQFNGYTEVINTNDIYYLSPEVFDLNGDGKKDVLLGTYQGYVRFYENIGTDAEPAFDTYINLQTTEGNDVQVSSGGAQIDLSDWDGDGFLDLLVGDDDGLITVFVNADIASGLDEPLAVKHLDFELAQNYPNPFNPATTFSYVLPEQARVSLSVYSLTGTLIETLVDAQQDAGSYSVQWHAGDYPSGVYFYRMQAGDYNAVKKCTLIK